jgi:hypothetical protein
MYNAADMLTSVSILIVPNKSNIDPVVQSHCQVNV